MDATITTTSRVRFADRTEREVTTAHADVIDQDDARATARRAFKSAFGCAGNYVQVNERAGAVTVSVWRGAHEYDNVVTVTYRPTITDIHADHVDVYSASVRGTIRVVEYDGEVIGTFDSGEDEAAAVDRIVAAYVAGRS